MRVLTTRLRCGVLYRFRMVKPPFCAWCPLTNRRKTGCEAELFLKNPKKYFEGFLSGASRISRVWGRHSPTRFPQGQNERKANFGTAVESCSKKLPLSSAALVCGYTGLLHQYSDCGGVFCPLFTTTTVKRGRFGKRSENFFIFPVCSLQQSGGVVCQRFLKMGAKKAVNLFKIYCLSTAVMGGGIKLSAVFQMEFICNRFLSAFQFLFCNLP